MATKINGITAVKKYMERDDKLSPGGGRKVETKEFSFLSAEERKDLAALAIKELGPDFELEIKP